MEDFIFTNSYGQRTKFPASPAAMLSLKERKIKYVGPEIIEALERVFDRAINGRGTTIEPEFIGLELNIKPKIVKEVLSRLRRSGMVEKGPNKYKILRKPTDQDYDVIKE